MDYSLIDYYSKYNRIIDCEEKFINDPEWLISKGQYPNCADYVFICIQIQENKIINMCWDGDGTTIMQASSGLLSSLCIGKDVFQVQDLLKYYDSYFNLSSTGSKDINQYYDLFEDNIFNNYKTYRSVTVPFSGLTKIIRGIINGK